MKRENWDAEQHASVPWQPAHAVLTIRCNVLVSFFLILCAILDPNFQECHQVRPRQLFTHKLHQQRRSVVSAIRGSQHSVAESMAWNEFDCIIALYESVCALASTGTSEPFSLQLAFLLEAQEPGFTVGVHAGLEDCCLASCNARDQCASIPRSAAHFFFPSFSRYMNALVLMCWVGVHEWRWSQGQQTRWWLTARRRYHKLIRGNRVVPPVYCL